MLVPCYWSLDERLSSVMAVKTGFPVHLATARHAQAAKPLPLYEFFPP